MGTITSTVLVEQQLKISVTPTIVKIDYIWLFFMPQVDLHQQFKVKIETSAHLHVRRLLFSRI